MFCAGDCLVNAQKTLLIKYFFAAILRNYHMEGLVLDWDWLYARVCIIGVRGMKQYAYITLPGIYRLNA